MNKPPLAAVWFGIFVNLTAANGVYSADASARADVHITVGSHANIGAVIVVPVNVSTSMSAACGVPTTVGTDDRCNVPVNLQVVHDGRLIGPQGVSLSLTPEADPSKAVAATLAYN